MQPQENIRDRNQFSDRKIGSFLLLQDTEKFKVLMFTKSHCR